MNIIFILKYYKCWDAAMILKRSTLCTLYYS